MTACFRCKLPIEHASPTVHEAAASYHTRCWELDHGKDREPGYVSGDPRFQEKKVNEPQFRLRPRNDFVIVREEKIESVRGVELPDGAAESKRFVVERLPLSDSVLDLSEGDIVLINGQEGVHYSFIPNHPGKIIVRQECVILVLEPVRAPASAYEEAFSDR